MNVPMNHPGWIAIGIVLILVGIWLIRWANRNSMTSAIAEATAEAAYNTVRKGAAPEMPASIKARLDDVNSAPGKTGKAKKIAALGVRHALSQVFGVAGFIAVVVGIMLAVFGAMYG
jgi:uncharacterized membrane protein